MTNNSELARELSGVENLEVPDRIVNRTLELMEPINEIFQGLLQLARDAGTIERGVPAAEIQGEHLGECLAYLSKSCFLLGYKRGNSGIIAEMTDKGIKDSAKQDLPYLTEAGNPLHRLVGTLFSGLIRKNVISEPEAKEKAQDIGPVLLQGSLQCYAFGAEYSQEMDK